MQIVNAQIYGTDFTFHQGSIGVAGDKFTTAGESSGEVVDAKGLYAIPGLVDIHFHGADGADFMDGTPEALHTIASYEASVGVTSICPASMTMGREDILKACANAAAFKAGEHEANLVGINMEGPFVSHQKVGAQNPAFVLKPSAQFFREAQQAAGGLIKLMAIAPETEGALETIRALKDEVLCSIAHTGAGYELACEAIKSGATHITHLYNAMPSLHHREPGPIAAGADAPWCEAEIICDGIHIHPAAVRCAFKLYGPDRMILISDSMMATGLKNGVYQLGGQKVTVTDRKALLDNGTIAGSATNLFDCMKTAVTKMQIPFETAVRCASWNPARSIGVLDTVGSIEPGKEASLLLVDTDLNLKAVLLRGRWLKCEL